MAKSSGSALAVNAHEPPSAPEEEPDEEVGTIEPPREPEPESDEEVGTIEPPS